MQPFRFADDQSRSAADERCLRGEFIRELLDLRHWILLATTR
jgi:hypothetical protein